ncbi:MAG: PIN domain-containing protein [Bacteroidia bacterium]
MIYLCCDTNIWINISNGLEPPRLLSRLDEEVMEGHIKLLLPEIILKEWERNKERFIVEQTQDSTNKQIDSLKKLNEFLERDGFELSFLWDETLGDEHEKIRKLRDKIEELINELKEHKTEITNRAKSNLETVESIFNNSNTIILPADSKSSMTVVNLAAEKKFPFENEKNNFADALIFYQFSNYLKDNGLEKGHFVTSNKKEFFPQNKLHDSLQKEIDETKSFFYKSLSEALNKTLNEELVNLKELKRIEELAEMADFDLDEPIYYCLVCQDNDDYEMESVISFNYDIEIIDSRTKIDKNQFFLEFEGELGDEFKGTDYDMQIDTEAESATCSHCGTEHIVCPECREIWDFQTYKINKIQNCEGCNLKFIYVEDKDRKGVVINKRLELLDNFDNCSKCGIEFDAKEHGIDICEKCNEEYINN